MKTRLRLSPSGARSLERVPSAAEARIGRLERRVNRLELATDRAEGLLLLLKERP